MIPDSVFGGVIAFLCAAFAVGFDAQTEVGGQLGRRYGTSILRAWPAYVFIIGWGSVDVGFYVAFLFNHDWAERAFNVHVEQNLLLTGVVVGLSAVAIVRTNLATVGSFQIGGEYFYVWSRSFLIDSLNRRRVQARDAFLRHYRSYCETFQVIPIISSGERTNWRNSPRAARNV